MNRITGRLNDGTVYVQSETGEEGVGAFTTQRRLPEIITRLAAYEDAAEKLNEGCDYCRKGIYFGNIGIESLMCIKYNVWYDKYYLYVNRDKTEIVACPKCGRKFKGEKEND